MPEYIDEVIQALIEKGVPFVRSFYFYPSVGFFILFNSDILPCLSLYQTLRGNCEQRKMFRIGISDDLGSSAICLEPPGMALWYEL